MPNIELNGATEATAGPIREALGASQKSKSLRILSSDTATTELPALAGNGGKTIKVNASANGFEFGDVGGAGTGDVVGPASSIDNGIARYDGTTGKLLQGSAVTISDNGTVGFVAAAAGFPSLNVPHGTAPSSPSNGDVWTTTAGLYARINGTTVGPFSAGSGLVNFLEAVSTASPNSTVPVVSLTANNAATNVDAALRPKGTGAVLAAVPDGAATGGNKRGANATDLQTSRSGAGMVAGGGSSVIAGGGNNTASSGFAVVSGGYNNTASTGAYALVAGGSDNSATGQNSLVAGGRNNTASGQYGSVLGGQYNTATGIGSVASGQYATTSTEGAWVHASYRFSSFGDCQTGLYPLAVSTSNATPGAMTANGAGAGTANIPVLRNNSARHFTGQVVARSTAGDVKTWQISGTIKRGANAAATALVGTPSVVSTDADTGASAWGLAVTADTTNGGLLLTATGALSTTILWCARIETAEVG